MKTEVSHIVFLTPGFAKSEEDSTTIPALQVYLKSIKRALPNTKMTLLTFQFPYTNETYNWHGIDVIPFNGKNKRLKKLWIWNKALQSLKHSNRKNPITAIHSFWIGECALIGSRFSKKYNISHVNTVMGQDAKVNNRYIKQLKNSPIKFVTLSDNHRATLYKNYKLNSVIIPWDLDTASFPALQESTIDILGVGSLNTVKNYSDFISVISDVVEVFPDLSVAIIGEGPTRQKLEAQITELNLSTNITLLGQLPRAQVLQKMSQASILLHTSTYESFGYVFLEALYAGMRIVSFNVGLAQTLPKWQVSHTKEGLNVACKLFLSQPQKEKNRIRLTKDSACALSYLKLYDA